MVHFSFSFQWKREASLAFSKGLCLSIRGSETAAGAGGARVGSTWAVVAPGAETWAVPEHRDCSQPCGHSVLMQRFSRPNPGHSDRRIASHRAVIQELTMMSSCHLFWSLITYQNRVLWRYFHLHFIRIFWGGYYDSHVRKTASAMSSDVSKATLSAGVGIVTGIFLTRLVLHF